MIRMFFEGVKWGVVPVQQQDGPSGGQINLFDEGSGIWAHAPFVGDALRDLVKALVPLLDDEQKKDVDSLLHGGIIVPGRDFIPGPQG